MGKIERIELDIVLNANVAPRNLSPSRLARSLEEIIRDAVQTRMPGFEIEIRSLKANWPGAPENFPEFKIEE